MPFGSFIVITTCRKRLQELADAMEKAKTDEKRWCLSFCP
jgi:hypothetical protein